MSIIGKLSENPNKQDIEFKKNKEKQEIHKKVEKKITKEEFKEMSWKNLKKNIRVDEKGHLTLFGKTMKYWLLEADWTDEQIKGYKEFKEKHLENQKQYIEKVKNQFKEKELLQNILQIWEQEAVQVSSSVWFKGFRKDDETILRYIKEINENLKIGVPISQEILDKNFNKIFVLMQSGEQEESIIGEDDIEKVKKIFFDKNFSIEQKEIQIFNLMRYGGLSGNSEVVKDIVADKLLETKDFKYEKAILENPKLIEYLEDKNIGKLREILSIEQADNFFDIYEKTNEKLEIALKNQLGEFNEQRQIKGEKSLNLEEFKKQNKFIENSLNITINIFKHILIFEKIEKQKYRGDKNESFTGIYTNMVGLAENKGIGDYFAFADENIDSLVDFGVTLAIGAMTMGVGMGVTVVSRGIFTGARAASLGNKFSRGLKIEKFLEKSKKTKAVLGFSGEAILDGIAFHEGATLAGNLLFRDLENWNHGLTNSHEIIKSIAFMGGLNSLKYVSKIKGMSKIMNYKMKIPKEYLEKNIILKVLQGTGNFTISGIREGSMMFGISGVIEEVLGNGWNPTVEEYLQFVALIQLMHLKDIRKK